MSDFFEREEQHEFFEPRQTQTRGQQGAALFNRWHQNEQQQQEFREQIQSSSGAGLSMREYNFLYDMREKEIIDDDQISKIISVKELSEYSGIDASIIYDNYDSIWQAISGDMDDRYASPMSRAQAINNSVQIAKNLEPMGRMGLDLQTLHGRINAANDENEKKILQYQADALWKKITDLRTANEALSRGMPRDALTTIITSTIQSAPMTKKSLIAGAAGAAVGGAIGAIGGGGGAIAGARIGYRLASTAASSAEMAGLMYVDLLAAGVNQQNAAGLAVLGGAVQGFIESGLGTVAGLGRSAIRAVGGRVLSQEARGKIAEAASKNFITKITQTAMASPVGSNVLTRTALGTLRQAGEEGLEELFQFLTEQAMLSLGDAMQDAPVERDSWFSPEFNSEMWNSILGGFAGGIGFGIVGLPLNFAGASVKDVAKKTTELQNLAIAIYDREEFRAAMRADPTTKDLTDEEIYKMFDAKAPERMAYHQEMREQAARAGHRTAAMPTLEAPGEMRRQVDGRLSMRIRHPDGEDGTGTAVLIDPPTKQRMGSIDFNWDIETNTIGIENIDLSQAVMDREAVIGDMIKELAYSNPDMGIEWNPDEAASAAAGVDLTALKNTLIADNPRGADWNLQFYQKGDRFAQTRAMNEDIDLIASAANVNRDTASDTWEAWDTAFRNFGLDTHETISKMGLTSEKDLRQAAAQNPEGIEAYVTQHLDQGKMAAQKTEQDIRGGTVVIKQDKDGTNKILSGREALKEAYDQLRAITVLTEKADPSTLHHEWLHFMVNTVIPNSPRYRKLLEDAVGKNIEDFTRQDHEWLAENYERYLRTGKAPTPGLKALFKRIAEALKQFVMNGNVSPKLREFFDQMLAGPDGAMLDTNSRQAQAVENKSHIQTDNEQQRAYAEMTGAERILQSDLHSAQEKAEMLYAMTKAERQLFRSELQQAINGTLNPGRMIPVGTAPDMYARNGLPDYNIFLPTNVIKKATVHHKVKMETIENLPELLNSPVMIMKSLTEPNAFVTLIDAVDNAGDPVIVSQNPTLKRRINITSIYGKENFDGFIKRCIEQNKIITADKNKVIKYVRPQELQLLKGTSLNDLSILSNISEDLSSDNLENSKILFQHTAEEKEIIDAAKAVYGTTVDFREAGYLLTDGSMLDFSGKKNGSPARRRNLDHREMNHFKHEGKEYKPGMLRFMQMGNIRLSPESGGIQLTQMPTAEQIPTLRKYIRNFNGDIIIDFANKENLDNEAGVEYFSENTDKILNDIKNYYEKGIVPEQKPMLFQTGWHGSPFINDLNRSNYFQHGWGRTFYSQKEAAQWAQNAISKTKGVEGQLLNASIPDDTNLLHWDNTIAEQPEAVRKVAESLITWNKNGKSEFNSAYNIRKFHDGSYGFYRSINGKAKWGTVEEAQAAAREEIKKTLTGEDFYNTLAERIGKKETSLLLDHLGVRGTKYFDKNMEKIGAKRGYNYVIYSESEIDINDMFFQTAFHGSPYRFDRFDSTHMGSGEGAQAYGWGHYFASKKEVAEWYHKNLSMKTITEPATQIINGKRMGQWIEHWKKLAETANSKDRKIYLTAANMLKYFGSSHLWDRQEALRSAKASGRSQEAIDLFDEIAREVKRPGQLYGVDIPGDEEMLDWDESLNDQPDQVKQIIKVNAEWIFNYKKIPDGFSVRFDEGFGRKYDLEAKTQEELLDLILENLTGQGLYHNMSVKSGSDKHVSLSLNRAGIKGIRYLDGSSRGAGEGSHNYVIFDDNDINITQMFFQMTREDIHARALRFTTWEQWLEADKFAEAYDDEASFRRDDTSEEPQGKKEIEAWYEKQWNEAQVLAREAALKEGDVIGTPANAEAVDPALLDGSRLDDEGDTTWNPELYENETNAGKLKEGHDADEKAVRTTQMEADDTSGNVSGNEESANKPITTSEANRRLIQKLPQVIDDFLTIIGQTMRTNLAHYGAVSEEDAAVRDQIGRDKERIKAEVHPYIQSIALRMTTGRKINDTQRKTVMSHMIRSLESGATIYRELYTTQTEDSEFVNYAKNEIADTGAKGEAQRAAAEAKGLTAFQRTRLAEKIINKDLAKKIRAGIAENWEIEDYLELTDKELQELEAETKRIDNELKQSQGETAAERAEAESWRNSYYEMMKKLRAAKKEAEQLEKKLERAKQTGANAVDRAKAGREKSEAKLKAQLAGKREEIRELGRQMKKEKAHALKQGKLEIAWKWAEAKQKQDKLENDKKRRIADRKAAARYLDANKKLTAWIMSSDRIGMNIWVRQRELILGIQNLLFNISKEAAEALKLDAEIKNIEKKIDKAQWRQARARDDAALEDAKREVNRLTDSLESLKLKRSTINAPDFSSMNIENEWKGSDTIDTGTIVYNGEVMSVEEFRKDFYEKKIRFGFMDSKLRKALRKSAPSAKTLGEKRKNSAGVLARSLSQEDLLAIKAVIQQLNKEGKANWERRQFAVRFHQQEQIKLLLFQQDELKEEDKKTGAVKRYLKARDAKSDEEREKQLAKGEKSRKTIFSTFDDKREVQHMDGDRKRALYKFIIRDRYRYANRRDVAIDKRTGRILDILGQGTVEEQEAEKNLSEYQQQRKRHNRAEKFMKELKETKITIEGISRREAVKRGWEYDTSFNLQEAEATFAPSRTKDLSLAELMFLSVALKNKFSYEHYIFGNLWSKDEQAYYEKFMKDGKMPKAVMDQIRVIGDEKARKIQEAIEKYIEPRQDLTQIIKAIRDDFEAHFPETRATFEDMFNQVVEGQDNYLPIIINEERYASAEKQEEVEALTMGSHQVRINPNDGMNHVRVDIGPTHQTAIETDIFKVYFQGVEREEHFNKFAPYVRDLNTVLRGRNNNSKQLSSHLKDMYGKWAVDRMYKHINLIGLPPSAKLNNEIQNASNVGRLLAGNAGVAYIAYNIPAWLAQYPNSIAAFFGKADTRLIFASLLEVMKPGSDLVDRVYEKSPKVKQRIISVADEFRRAIKEEEGKLKEAHSKFIEMGMWGQRHADRTMVCAGWWALYQTALKDGKSEEDAVVFADEITAETQPDTHALETSPLFKDEGLGKLFLRFGLPLNVVWQNLTYDNLISREKSMGSVIARITAYGMAALIVAAMRGALAKKDDEEKDNGELIRKVFFYMMFAQVTESVPLMGSAASATVEQLITGDATFYTQRNFEMAQRLFNIPVKLSKEKYEGAFKDAFHALSLAAGLPISQINRIVRAVQNEDPRIIFGYNPD